MVMAFKVVDVPAAIYQEINESINVWRRSERTGVAVKRPGNISLSFTDSDAIGEIYSIATR